MLPNDPNILLSLVNTRLRDEYASLSELCAALDEDEDALAARLAAAGWRYDREANQFVRGQEKTPTREENAGSAAK
ncbi:MAG: DUF4250 domain-containing protein [Clostridia bacterium]|nr:DUF4250 domain-containing protein [Clostridia bacterium]